MSFFADLACVKSSKKGSRSRGFSNETLERRFVVRPSRGLQHLPSQLSYVDLERFQMQTLIIYKLCSNQNYHTFTSTLLIKIILCSQFSGTKVLNHKCFEMRFLAKMGYAGHLHIDKSHKVIVAFGNSLPHCIRWCPTQCRKYVDAEIFRPRLTPTSIKNNTFLKLILLETSHS